MKMRELDWAGWRGGQANKASHFSGGQLKVDMFWEYQQPGWQAMGEGDGHMYLLYCFL